MSLLMPKTYPEQTEAWQLCSRADLPDALLDRIGSVGHLALATAIFQLTDTISRGLRALPAVGTPSPGIHMLPQKGASELRCHIGCCVRRPQAVFDLEHAKVQLNQDTYEMLS